MPEIVLPPLTPKEIEHRDYQENLLNRGLSECWRAQDFDAERAEKLARAYVIEIFNTIRTFYRMKVGYRAEWLPEIVHEAVYRTLTVYKGHRALGISQMGNIARDTVMDYLRNTSNSEHARSEFNIAFMLTQIPAPQPDDAPLLRMAKEEARRTLTPNPQLEAVPVPDANNGTVICRRIALLDEYKRATGANDYQIYNAQNSPIHKPDFYHWKNGKLPEKSKTAKDFEAFLKAKKRPIRKSPTS